MDEATLAQTIMTALIFAIFLGYLIWAIRSGQFKNVEEAKFSMFRSSTNGSDKPAETGKEGEEK